MCDKAASVIKLALTDHSYFLHLTSLRQFVGVKNDQASRSGLRWLGGWPAAVNRDDEAGRDVAEGRVEEKKKTGREKCRN